MRPTRLIFPLAGLAVIATSWWIGLGSELGVSAVLVGVLFLITIGVGSWMQTDQDPWLAKLVPMAFAAKVAGTVARWGMVELLYGVGDSYAYHAAGIRFVEDWRNLEVPEILGRSMGTRFVETVTSLLYVPYVPHILGGFVLFSTIAFFGQLLYYAAFRRALGGRGLRLYGAVVFFLPTFLFWPSSIGKDALMTFFLGLAAYGAVRLFDSYHLRHGVLLGLGLWGATVIRSHVAALMGGSILVAILIGRARSWSAAVGFRRIVALGLAVVGAVAVLALFAETFGLGEGGEGILSVDLSLEDLDPVVADIERRTGQGGSAVDAGFVQTVAQLPLAFSRVMFSPFPWQAQSGQALLAAVEGLAIFGIFVWALPAIVRLGRRIRRYPYLLMGLVYTLGFSIAFSAILNLGILTRQRGQVMGLFMALCIGARAVAAEEKAGGDGAARRAPLSAPR